MKNYITILLLALTINALAQSGNGSNYVMTYTPNEAVKETDFTSLSIRNSRVSIQYMDEFGRPEQVLEQQGTPSGNDLISLTEYDEAGRVSKQWIPAPVNGGTGVFRSADAVKNKSSEYYGGNAYSETCLLYTSDACRRRG